MRRYRLLQRNKKFPGFVTWLRQRHPIPLRALATGRLNRQFFGPSGTFARPVGFPVRSPGPDSPSNDQIQYDFAERPATDDDSDPLVEEPGDTPGSLTATYPETDWLRQTQEIPTPFQPPAQTDSAQIEDLPESTEMTSRWKLPDRSDIQEPPRATRRRPGTLDTVQEPTSQQRPVSEPRSPSTQDPLLFTHDSESQSTDADLEPEIEHQHVDAEQFRPPEHSDDTSLEKVGDQRTPVEGEPVPPVDSSQSAPSADSDPVAVPPHHADSLDERSVLTPRGEADRSPQAWLRRLQGQAARDQDDQRDTRSAATVRNEQPVTPARTFVPHWEPAGPVRHARTVEPAAPVSRSARRFLRPLVGVDPDSVAVRRDYPAQQFARDLDAEAVAAEEEILLADANESATPEQLGLLAHELTHVARGRQPRFIPPVVRSARMDSTDEESIALGVETEVRRIAEDERNPVQANSELPDQRNNPARPIATSTLGGESPVWPEGAGPSAPISDTDADWGGLPAPWQPMPEWPARHQVETLDGFSSANVPGPGRVSSGDSPPEPNVQLAERGRSPESTGSSDETDVTEASARSERVEPDLDALARRVYGLLRRRLAAEQRRTGLERHN